MGRQAHCGANLTLILRIEGKKLLQTINNGRLNACQLLRMCVGCRLLYHSAQGVQHISELQILSRTLDSDDPPAARVALIATLRSPLKHVVHTYRLGGTLHRERRTGWRYKKVVGRGEKCAPWTLTTVRSNPNCTRH